MGMWRGSAGDEGGRGSHNHNNILQEEITSIKSKCLVLTELCKILLMSLNCEANNVFAYINFNQSEAALLVPLENSLGRSRTTESKGWTQNDGDFDPASHRQRKQT